MYKILSLDGGGIKGVFPISFLASVEEAIGDSITNYFDLIVGTSTGGIIAIGLGLGMTSQEILAFYENLGPKIFNGFLGIKHLRQVACSKYKQAPLQQALSETFREAKLGNSNKRLVIPSLNLETGAVHLYKTAHHPRFEKDYKMDVVNIALATASAPTYFPAFQGVSGLPLVDGGMWANNPTGVAVVEAIGILQWPKESIKVLSLGCTTEPLKIGWARRIGIGWATKSVDVFMTAQCSAAISTAQVLLGKEKVFRVSTHVAKGRFSLDGVKDIKELRGLGDSEARMALPMMREEFFSEKAESFSPVYTL
jgi:patatin-like phospholipase/acyl hydrolase